MADDGTTRGQFLSLTTVGLGAVIGGVIGVPITAYMLAPVTDEVQFEPVFLGKVGDFPSSGSFDPKAATYVEDTQNPRFCQGFVAIAPCARLFVLDHRKVTECLRSLRHHRQ